MTFSSSLLRVLDALVDERVAKAELHRARAAAALREPVAALASAPPMTPAARERMAPRDGADPYEVSMTTCVDRDSDAFWKGVKPISIRCEKHGLAPGVDCPPDEEAPEVMPLIDPPAPLLPTEITMASPASAPAPVALDAEDVARDLFPTQQTPEDAQRDVGDVTPTVVPVKQPLDDREHGIYFYEGEPSSP